MLPDCLMILANYFPLVCTQLTLDLGIGELGLDKSGGITQPEGASEGMRNEDVSVFANYCLQNILLAPASPSKQNFGETSRNYWDCKLDSATK